MYYLVLKTLCYERKLTVHEPSLMHTQIGNLLCYKSFFFRINIITKCSSECFGTSKNPAACKKNIDYNRSFCSASENRKSFKKLHCLCGGALKYLTLIVTTEECTWNLGIFRSLSRTFLAHFWGHFCEVLNTQM